MKKLGLGLLKLSIAFVLLFSGMSGLGDVLLNATEIAAENTQNESESTTNVGEQETSEVVEEPITEETTVAVEESTAVIKSAEEESNMAIQAAISEEEQQLLNQLNPKMKSLESEQTDFLTAEDTPESFIVFLKEDKDLYDSATEVFSASAGKSVAPKLSTLIVKKDEVNLPDEQFISALSNLSSVESVVKNTVSQMTNYEVSSEKLDTTVAEDFSTVDSYGAPNDPLYAYQWEMQQMQMSKVWDLGTGKGVKIGIFDTGFQSAYLDSTGVEFDTNRILPLVKYAEDNACYSYGEHGTMVMSIAGAVKSNNGIGMAGVASSATFQPYLAGYGCSGVGFGLSSTNFVKVYEHALANGVNIMNMSFGGTYYQSAQNTVIQRATEQGLISVAARGNDGRKFNPTVTNYPACYSGVVMVGALTQSNTLADFSTYGDCGNKNLVTAYGANVTVATYRTDGLYRATVSGTSFSSPITAGVLAVMKSTNPTATATELKNALLSTATDLGSSGYDQEYGYGGINPLAATQDIQGEVSEGDMVYYLNSDKTIKYAAQYSNGQRVAIYYYRTGTTIQNKQSRIRYKFILKADGSEIILQLDEYDDNNNRVRVSHYFNGTTFANRDGNIQYSYLLKTDGSGIILQRNEYNKSVKRIGVVHYFANTTFPNRTGKEQYKYILNADGSERIVQRDEYNTSAKRIGAVHYFANTTFANRVGKEQYKYILKADGSQIILQRDEYNLSGKRVRIVHYLANTAFANRINRRQYIYTLTADGSQIILQRDGYDTEGRRVSVALYFSNTTFANRANGIRFIYILNVDEMVLRKDEYNTAGKRIAYYLFASNTKFDATVDEKIIKKVVV